MPSKPENVDEYLDIGCGRCEFGGTPNCKVHPWSEELTLLRKTLQGTELTEEIKWSAPCYTHSGRNVLTLSALKDSTVVSFFRGAELTDPDSVLQKPGKNSRFARYIKFTDSKQITTMKSALLGLIKEAIELEASGTKTTVESSLPDMPQELLEAFETDASLKNAFDELTPGRKRGYLLHFNSAKQSKTRANRIGKCKPKILQGKGWNER